MRSSQHDQFVTTNRDYGSFYLGRSPGDEIALELALNDQVRNERRRLPSIAYDIMFDKQDSLEIVHREKNKMRPVTTRRQMKYRKTSDRASVEHQSIIRDALESYGMFIACIYANKPTKNPQLSKTVLDLIANELYLITPNLSADELAEHMVAVTVPREYLGASSLNWDKEYPGSVNECTQTPRLQRLLDQFEAVRNAVSESKQQYDAPTINAQSMLGDRYIYNPFAFGRPCT